MGEVGILDDATPGSSRGLDIETVEAPIALCSNLGHVQLATPSALALLRRISLIDSSVLSVSPDLWRALERENVGETVVWRPPGSRQDVLSCTRYYAARGSYLLLLIEVSAKHARLAERLHRQQLSVTERLVASIAHDIRSSVASVVYSADFLEVGGGALAPTVMSETLSDLTKASANLQLTVDALLDYARLGPSVSVSVSLREVLNRAQGSLRTHYREGAHRLRVDVAPRAEWVRGNPIAIEQIFVNLLLNAAEASSAPRCVIVTAFPALLPQAPRVGSALYVCIRVWDDGPGIPAELRQLVFDPFFTTKNESSGMGLSVARQAAESLDGVLELTDDESGTCFSLFLPSAGGAP
ncbi:MAG: HAMP domain-containing sensor histidine kinase [Polyangiaceae bacterium]